MSKDEKLFILQNRVKIVIKYMSQEDILYEKWLYEHSCLRVII